MKRTVENEILDLENRFWTSMKDKDVETALELVHDPCIVTGPQGISRIDKQTFAGMVAKASGESISSQGPAQQPKQPW